MAHVYHMHTQAKYFYLPSFPFYLWTAHLFSTFNTCSNFTARILLNTHMPQKTAELEFSLPAITFDPNWKKKKTYSHPCLFHFKSFHLEMICFSLHWSCTDVRRSRRAAPCRPNRSLRTTAAGFCLCWHPSILVSALCIAYLFISI